MTAIYKRKKVNFKSVNDLNQLVLDSLPTLPKNISVVVAVPRSGYLVASLIALNLNLPLCSFGEYMAQTSIEGGRRTQGFDQNDESSGDSAGEKKALIVDDSVSSGWEMRRIREELDASPLAKQSILLAAYVSSSARDLVDIALEVIDPPQMFEWNLYHHPHLINSCVDIDGVLCRDATQEEDDDGERYINFLENVEPRIIPTVKIGWLVTSRLEKYRPQTEAWMKRHGIEYEHLVMQDVPDLATRRKLKSDGKFKAKVYAGLDAFFFLESSVWQAEEITTRTGKAVFCVDNGVFMQGKVLPASARKTLSRSKRGAKKVRQKLGALARKLHLR